VIVPADQFAANALVRAAAQVDGPIYIRMGRPKASLVHLEKTHFEIGKGIVLKEGKDLTIIANGLLVWEALAAAETLLQEGIAATVVDMHTVKPIDKELIESLAKKTGAIVTAEEHQIWGGLGSAVARTLAETCPSPQEFIGIQDTYAESGKPDELFQKYELSAPFIVTAAKRVVGRKKSESKKLHSCST
jgi:transketolase